MKILDFDPVLFGYYLLTEEVTLRSILLLEWLPCFFFRRYGWHALQQNLAIASSSSFLCLFSNSRRSSDRTNKWPLRMTLMCDLDLSVLSYFEQWLCSCWTKHLQIFTEGSLGYGHSSDAKISLAICKNSIYGYIMFSTISWKCVCGHNFWTKAARMMIFSLNERSCHALHFIMLT